ncbi:MAG: SIR2 family protein [Chloroflexota bacterium]|nr:SIR2 family protein [Chloroflexota bacterium]
MRDLKQRRVVADPPPVVLLGAGASVESGIGAMTDLFQFVDCANFDEFCNYIAPLTASERYRLLSQFLQSRQPAQVTPGYQALAALCAEAYFDTILTTNLDPLLDDALAAAHLWRKDYMLLVNGVIRSDRLDVLATAPSPRVKVIKLHGDLFQRFMAWTPAEMDTFLTDIAACIQTAIHGRDILVVGHSLRDERIRELAMSTGGSIWYTGPTGVPDYLAASDRVRAVIGPNGAFEKLFAGLARELGVGIRQPSPVMLGVERSPVEPSQPTSAGEWAQTVDDMMASVVGILNPQGMAAMTGFVLAEPRVIVTDGYRQNVQAISDPPVIHTFDNRQLETRVIRQSQSHPFGPLVLQVPTELKVHGLRLAVGPLNPNMAVRVGVAAGKRVGVSSGSITYPREQRIDVAPIGRVDNLVSVDCVVAPGASGAPVVDNSFAVLGFIVAGATDNPPSFMYPAARWADALQETPAPKKSRAQRTTLGR